MKLTGLHFLLTLRCSRSCDHCFVWGSPHQQAVFRVEQIQEALRQAAEIPGLETIYFEGGEPFLYQELLAESVRIAKRMGFWAGIVTNGFWVTSAEHVRETLVPLAAAGLDQLEVSRDSLHDNMGLATGLLKDIAHEMGIQVAILYTEAPSLQDQQPGDVMYRGRAAVKMTPGMAKRSWLRFTACEHEDLVNPRRMHLDPYGNLHICQGLVIGNIRDTRLRHILAAYDPETHPVVWPLLMGGPAQLAETYQLEVQPGYVDACHLCYELREQLRSRYPHYLVPEALYGFPESPGIKTDAELRK
ncbi:MAG: radical SAM protein [Chloroflexi bacterium]|nr:radical SAM protein [Chloroflexota bacterium]